MKNKESIKIGSIVQVIKDIEYPQGREAEVIRVVSKATSNLITVKFSNGVVSTYKEDDLLVNRMNSVDELNQTKLSQSEFSILSCNTIVNYENEIKGFFLKVKILPNKSSINNLQKWMIQKLLNSESD